MDSGYGGNCERNSRALEQPQSQPVNETQRRQRRERSKGNFLKIQYMHASYSNIAFFFF